MKKRIFLIVALAFTFTAAIPGFAQDSEQPAENWTDINLAITDNHVIPGYALLDSASAGLATAATNFCANPDAASLDAFRDGFQGSMDAWQQIQHVQFGPVTYFNWNFRMQYWPDEKATGARQLDALIAGGNGEALASDSFARESVGVQGYPALERLLFEEGSLAAFQADSFRCQVASTIAHNIGEIATGVHQRWVDEFRSTIANADDRGFFESAEDATIGFLKAQVEPVRRIQQQKVEAVIGESEASARIRRAESWRSARSLKNLRLNVLALENLFKGSAGQVVSLDDVFLNEDVDKINNTFTSLNEALAVMPDSLQTVLAEEGGHASLLAIASQLDALFEAFEAGLKNTDLYLGFNSLDGD